MAESAEVHRTLHAYCELLDARHLDELVARVYVEDAVDDRQRGEPLRGREAIRRYFEQALTHLRATAHILSNVDVTIGSDGQTAAATSRVTAYHWRCAADEAPPVAADFVLLGTYTDRLRRTIDGWRIEHRLVAALGPSGLAAGVLPRVFAGFGGRS